MLPGDGGSVDGGAILRWLAENDLRRPCHALSTSLSFPRHDARCDHAAGQRRFELLYRAAGISRSGQLEPLSSEPDSHMTAPHVPYVPMIPINRSIPAVTLLSIVPFG